MVHQKKVKLQYGGRGYYSFPLVGRIPWRDPSHSVSMLGSQMSVARGSLGSEEGYTAEILKRVKIKAPC